MPMRRISAVVSPLLAAVDWAFSAAAPCIDLLLGSVAAAWFGMELLRPDVFDRGSFTGLQWAPDWVWIVFVGATVLLHLAGLLNLDFVQLRTTACLSSAWYWIVVSISLTRGGLVPGTWTYGIIGTVGLAGAIYVNGRAPRRP